MLGSTCPFFWTSVIYCVLGKSITADVNCWKRECIWTQQEVSLKTGVGRCPGDGKRWEWGHITEKQRGGERCTNRSQDLEQESPQNRALRNCSKVQVWMQTGEIKSFPSKVTPKLGLFLGRFLCSEPSPAGRREIPSRLAPQKWKSEPAEASVAVGGRLGSFGRWLFAFSSINFLS